MRQRQSLRPGVWAGWTLPVPTTVMWNLELHCAQPIARAAATEAAAIKATAIALAAGDCTLTMAHSPWTRSSYRVPVQSSGHQLGAAPALTNSAPAGTARPKPLGTLVAKGS